MNRTVGEPPSGYGSFGRLVNVLLMLPIGMVLASGLANANCQNYINPTAMTTSVNSGENGGQALVLQVQKLQTEVQVQCGNNLGGCDEQELQQIVQEALTSNKSPLLKRWWDYTSIALRRTSVVGMWAGTIILPPAIVAVMTQKLPPFLSAVATLIAMNMSASIFMYLRTPIDQRLGPPMAKFAMRIWKPAPGDHWGNVVAGVNENERAVSELLGPMIIIIRDYLATAGVAIANGDTRLAAINYLEAIRQSLHQYNGVNIGHDAIVDMVHSRINLNQEPMSLQINANVIADLLQQCNELIEVLSDKQIPKGFHRESLKEFTAQTLKHWFN